MNLIPATYKVLYNQKNITRDISDHLISLNYNDKVAGESDELSLSLEDTDLLWQNDWYPQKGAKLEAWIYQDSRELYCGIFSVDQIELTVSRSGGDVVNISALAALTTHKMRTKNSSGHSNKSLREIANTIAAKNNLTVQGHIDNIILQRVTQYNETDLGFLYRISKEYGYTFSVRGDKITFTSVYELEAAPHIFTLDKTELTAHSIKDNTMGIYSNARVRHHSPKTNTLIESTEDAADIDDANDDTLEVKERVENKQQAEAKSKAALHAKNSREKTGSIATAGNVLLVSGINFELTGLGHMSGIQHATATTHTLDRSGGYATTSEIKAVAKIDKSKWKPKTKRTTSTGTTSSGRPLTALEQFAVRGLVIAGEAN